MIKQTEWFTRKFTAIRENGLFPNILERLAGTPVRIKNKINNFPPGLLTKTFESKWSIQEEIGHLLDLEELWLGRIYDFRDGKEELRPADLENKKTHKANHNDKNINILIEDFSKERNQLVKLLTTLNDNDLNKNALHPRLKIPMRIIDLIYFVAEHDDHHLARMTNLYTILKRK